MLTLEIPGHEFFNEETEEFVTIGDVTLELQHSLSSLSKWESEWEIPFLDGLPKTNEQVLDYIRCMCLTPNIAPEVFLRLTDKHLETINNHINAKKTATWFNERKSAGKSKEVITTELIYFWMVTYQIPFECQYWHLERLLTLIKIVNIKQSSNKSTMSKRDLADERRALNESRQKQFGTEG